VVTVKFIYYNNINIIMETVTIPREEYEVMKQEIKTLRATALYKRLLSFEQNIKTKKYTRKDLGF